MLETYTIRVDQEAMEAVKTALRLGALHGRSSQLAAIMQSQSKQGYGNLADGAQRELEMLALGADAILAAHAAPKPQPLGELLRPGEGT